MRSSRNFEAACKVSSSDAVNASCCSGLRVAVAAENNFLNCAIGWPLARWGISIDVIIIFIEDIM